jgi:hypothetical protein
VCVATSPEALVTIEQENNLADRRGGKHFDHAVRGQLLLLISAPDTTIHAVRQKAGFGNDRFNGGRRRAEIVFAADLRGYGDDLSQIIPRDLGLARDKFDMRDGAQWERKSVWARISRLCSSLR